MWRKDQSRNFESFKFRYRPDRYNNYGFSGMDDWGNNQILKQLEAKKILSDLILLEVMKLKNSFMVYNNRGKEKAHGAKSDHNERIRGHKPTRIVFIDSLYRPIHR